MSSLIVWIPGITSLFCSVLSVKSYYIIVSYPNHVLELITGAIIIIINDVGIPSTFPDILPPARQNLSDQLLLLYAQICFVSWPMLHGPCSSFTAALLRVGIGGPLSGNPINLLHILFMPRTITIITAY